MLCSHRSSKEMKLAEGSQEVLIFVTMKQHHAVLADNAAPANADVVCNRGG